jgi:hypothetical protein
LFVPLFSIGYNLPDEIAVNEMPFFGIGKNGQAFFRWAEPD